MSHIVSKWNIDEYLAANKYDVDNDESHIVLTDELDDDEFDKLIMVCPAALYKRAEDGAKTFDYAGCLECGTCRIACGDSIIASWRYPSAGCGVEYRYG